LLIKLIRAGTDFSGSD